MIVVETKSGELRVPDELVEPIRLSVLRSLTEFYDDDSGEEFAGNTLNAVKEAIDVEFKGLEDGIAPLVTALGFSVIKLRNMQIVRK